MGDRMGNIQRNEGICNDLKREHWCCSLTWPDPSQNKRGEFSFTVEFPLLYSCKHLRLQPIELYSSVEIHFCQIGC